MIFAYACPALYRLSARVRLGSLPTSDWVVADGMTELSFRRLPALLCLH